jgi:hypothetical protein
MHSPSITKILLLCFCLTGSILSAQENKSYFITKKGEKVMFNAVGEYGRCNGNPDMACFNYINEKGKSDYVSWSKIDSVNMHGWYFLPMPTDEKGKKTEVMELVIQNEKYKLFRIPNIYQNNKLYIYDHNGKLVEKDIKLTKGKIEIGMKLDSEKNNIEVMNLILKYFPDCDGLKAEMQSNYDTKVNLLNNVSYRACGNVPDPELLFKK